VAIFDFVFPELSSRPERRRISVGAEWMNGGRQSPRFSIDAITFNKCSLPYPVHALRGLRGFFSLYGNPGF
jgi:hypothetical protein